MQEDFTKITQKCAREAAEAIVQEDGSGLLSKEAQKKKVELDLIHDISETQHKMQDGLRACLLSLAHCDDVPLSVNEVVSELQKCFSAIKSQEAISSIGKNIFLGSSWKEQFGISNDCMQSLYCGAKALFEDRDFFQAENAFFVICSLDPSQFAYWVGFGHSCFQNKHFAKAVNAYGMASGLEPENVWPHIWAANCFEAEKDVTSVTSALQEAIRVLRSLKSKDMALIHSLEERIKKNNQGK